MVEGPLNNLKESLIQFSKPRKLVNATNPVILSAFFVSFLQLYKTVTATVRFSDIYYE